MNQREVIEYLLLIEEYLHRNWLKRRDPDTKAEIERIAAVIAELKRQCE
jgi:hypothetical protein